MQLEVSSSSIKSMQSTHRTASGLQFDIDEPPAMGGQDQGPNPLEAVLGAWAGCLIIVARMVAQEHQWTLGEIRVHTTGQFDPRGFMGVSGVSPYFSEVAADIELEHFPQSQAESLKHAVESRCPVSGMLRAAGVALSIRLSAI